MRRLTASRVVLSKFFAAPSFISASAGRTWAWTLAISFVRNSAVKTLVSNEATRSRYWFLVCGSCHTALVTRPPMLSKTGKFGSPKTWSMPEGRK